MQTLIQFPCLPNDCGSRMEKVFVKSQIYSAGLCGLEYVDSLNRNSNKGTWAGQMKTANFTENGDCWERRPWSARHQIGLAFRSIDRRMNGPEEQNSNDPIKTSRETHGGKGALNETAQKPQMKTAAPSPTTYNRKSPSPITTANSNDLVDGDRNYRPYL
jgi:hypothetical protein